MNWSRFSLKQTLSPQGPIPVPLLAAYQFATGPTVQVSSCGRVTAITLQVPFELKLSSGNPSGVRLQNVAHLVVSEDGAAAAAVELQPLPSHIHVLRNGDTITSAGRAGSELSLGDPIVVHADGKLVSQLNPAKPGEMLVMYAVGLGGADPPVRSGEATPTPAPRAFLLMDFDFRPNASPSGPFEGPVEPFSTSAGGRTSTTPAFAGLTPGFVGLYQVNFVVPQPTIRCFPDVTGTGLVVFNVTVSIGGPGSFDGAQLCVRP